MVELVINLVILAIMCVVGVVVYIQRKMKGPDPNAFRFGANVIDPSRGMYGGPPGPGGYGPQGGYGAPPGYGPSQGGYGAPAGYGPSQGGAPGGYGPSQGGYSAAPAFAPQAPPGAIRLVVRADHTFERISDCMTQAGMAVTQAPGPAMMPGEPSTAVWQDDTAQVRYAFDPRTYLRAMEIVGPGAATARQSVVAIAQLPVMDGAQILRLMQSSRREDRVLGLAAAEHLGPWPEAQVYRNMIPNLAGSVDAEIAKAAARVHQRIGY